MASLTPPRKRVMLRPAWPDEGPVLSDIAMKSKAHWGYDDVFMERCRDELTITRARIARERIRVAEVDGVAAGFSSMNALPGKASVEDLFVLPAFIGSGIGHLLINDLLHHALRHGIRLLHVESDPNATAFYARQGFTHCGEVASHSIPERKLPLMEIRF